MLARSGAAQVYSPRMSWDRPPPGTSVAEIFERWLPAAYEASGRRAPLEAPLIRATLSGTGGGAWDVRATDGALAVMPAGRELPDVWVRQPVPDFRAALEGDSDLPSLLPPGWDLLDLLFLDPRDVDLLRQISGRVLTEVTGRRARRWSLDVAFGKAGVMAGRPRATVRLDGKTFEGLQAGTLPPMQPLLDGRLSVEGDKALAMQLMLLLVSRLNRR